MQSFVQKLLSFSVPPASAVFLMSVATAATVRFELEFEANLANGKHVYEICASCHLPEGWGNEDGTYPQLAGQNQKVLIKQLLDIRSGKRDNPIMYPFVSARTIPDYQSLADVVAYISLLPMTPENGKGPWGADTVEYRQGKTLYQEKCSGCHGASGEGNDALSIPKLQGQHYAYNLRQIRHISRKERRSDPAMLSIVEHLKSDQIEKIVNYVSRLPVPKSSLAPDIHWRNPDFSDELNGK